VVKIATCRMKKKISVSIDEETIELLKEKLGGREFRSRSHMIELAIDEFLKKIQGEENGN
jgi:Arc/MetJ-type ribon-helix-helix transcriptional regulator